jgi:hypothetical protein
LVFVAAGASKLDKQSKPLAVKLQEIEKIGRLEAALAFAQGVHRFAATAHFDVTVVAPAALESDRCRRD